MALRNLSKKFVSIKSLARHYSEDVFSNIKCPPPNEDPCKKYGRGLVLGIYDNPNDQTDPGELTETAERYNNFFCNRLVDLLRFVGHVPRLGEVRVFYNIDPENAYVAVAGLGKKCTGYDVYEQMDIGKENIRIASAVACRALQPMEPTRINVESFGHTESAAEGSAMAVWIYQEKKHKSKQRVVPHLELHDDCDWTGWQIGLQKAAAQNLARQLADTPANLMTPTSFAQNAVEVLCKSGVNVEVKVRGWAETQKMYAFLQAAQGSCEPPIFLELSYYGCSRDERPIVMIGKGLTYNSGGLCLMTHKDQIHNRGEVSGAACVVAACRAVAGLQLPLNIRGLIPLCENMPGCAAMRPGDIVKAMNGKSIQIPYTDCAGKLLMADALCYAQNFWPRFIIDIGTNSDCCLRSIGRGATVVYSNSEALWEYMLAASMHTGDRVWRYPLWEHFTRYMTDFPESDTATFNKHKSPRHYAGSCKCAAFLNEFVPCGDWIHMDNCNTYWTDGDDFVYLGRGMTGRPTRTVVEFLSQLVCHQA